VKRSVISAGAPHPGQDVIFMPIRLPAGRCPDVNQTTAEPSDLAGDAAVR